MYIPLFLEDWFPSDSLNVDSDWIAQVEDPCLSSNSNLEAEALRLAIESGDLREFKKYLATGSNPNLYDDTMPLLSIASHLGNIEIVKALLEAGADPNLQSKDGYTALTFAAKSGHLEIVQILVKAGTNIRSGFYGISAGSNILQGRIFEYLLRFITDDDMWFYESENVLKRKYPDWGKMLSLQTHTARMFGRQ